MPDIGAHAAQCHFYLHPSARAWLRRAGPGGQSRGAYQGISTQRYRIYSELFDELSQTALFMRWTMLHIKRFFFICLHLAHAA